MPTTTQTLPQFNYNVTVGAANTLSGISIATGIDNISRSSIIRAISEASASDVQFALQNQQSVLTQTYVDTATDTFLDYKGDQYGVQRNIVDKIILFATDQAVQIVPVANNVNLGQALSGNLTIPANTLIANITTKYSIYTINQVNIPSNSTAYYIDAIIQATNPTTTATDNTDETTITINQGQLVPLVTSSTLAAVFSNVQLQFTQAVIIELANESDDNYRARVINAKTQPGVGTVSAFSLLLNEIPALLGYNIQIGTRSRNSVDINIVTQSYIDEQNYAYIPLYVQNLARSYFNVNSDIIVQFPSELEIFIQYTTGISETISNDTINQTIQSIFNSTYLYSQSNVISFGDLQNLIKGALPQLSSFVINTIVGFDANLGEYIFSATTDVTIPVGYYSYINDLTNLTNLANAIS